MKTSHKPTMKAALAALCGCLQMMAMVRSSANRITERHVRLHPSRASRDPATLEMKRLRRTAKKTGENTQVGFQLAIRVGVVHSLSIQITETAANLIEHSFPSSLHIVHIESLGRIRGRHSRGDI